MLEGGFTSSDGRSSFFTIMIITIFHDYDADYHDIHFDGDIDIIKWWRVNFAHLKFHFQKVATLRAL